MEGTREIERAGEERGVVVGGGGGGMSPGYNEMPHKSPQDLKNKNSSLYFFFFLLFIEEKYFFIAVLVKLL